jgi:flagellar motor switch protein FliM
MSPQLAMQTRALLLKTINKTHVPIDVVLGRVRVPLQEVLNLEVGDIVQLDSIVKDPILIEVGGLPRFTARPGRRGEQSAVQLDRVLHDEFAVEAEAS